MVQPYNLPRPNLVRESLTSCGLILFFDWLCDVTVLFVGDFKFFSETSRKAGSSRGSDFDIPGIFEYSGPKTNQNFTSGLSISVFSGVIYCPDMSFDHHVHVYGRKITPGLLSSERYYCPKSIFDIKCRVIFGWKSYWIRNWNRSIWLKASSFLDIKKVHSRHEWVSLFWNQAYSPI